MSHFLLHLRVLINYIHYELQMRQFLYFIFIIISIQVSVTHSILYTSSNITVVCFHRNEPDIIDYWFQYYSSIFNINQILFLDNNSDEPYVLERLLYWESQGKVESNTYN